jgi:hypothetical protein
MRKINTVLFCSFLALLAACKKDNSTTPLPNRSVGLALTAGKDTMELPISILSDAAIVVRLQAALGGEVSGADHWVKLTVDTTKITAYRAKYGNVPVLPLNSYYFYQPMVRIAAGSLLSDPAQLNIYGQTKLKEYSTYVLPVVVQSVDDNPDVAAPDKVLYLVFKTGRPAFASKAGWTIAGFSSVQGTNTAANVIDVNETGTFWCSNITQTMPQWVAINFNNTLAFSAVAYNFPAAVVYPTQGGYPTSIKIETSMDGTSWTDNGTYAGNLSGSMQTLITGNITARYLRFTALSVVNYLNLYNAVLISGIRVVPQ